MKVKETKSGLVIPVSQEKPKRRLGFYEIHDEDKREKAIKAMSDLWDALDLSKGGGGIVLPESNNHTELHMNLYKLLGETILGKDCPIKEILC